MGWRVVQKPNGLFNIYSTIVDNFIVEDCTEEEIVEEYVIKARKEAENTAQGVIQRAKERDEGHYYDTVTRIEQIHGDLVDDEEE